MSNILPYLTGNYKTLLYININAHTLMNQCVLLMTYIIYILIGKDPIIEKVEATMSNFIVHVFER